MHPPCMGPPQESLSARVASTAMVRAMVWLELPWAPFYGSEALRLEGDSQVTVPSPSSPPQTTAEPSSVSELNVAHNLLKVVRMHSNKKTMERQAAQKNRPPYPKGAHN